jgi:hypothetical protein
MSHSFKNFEASFAHKPTVFNNGQKVSDVSNSVSAAYKLTL